MPKQEHCGYCCTATSADLPEIQRNLGVIARKIMEAVVACEYRVSGDGMVYNCTNPKRTHDNSLDYCGPAHSQDAAF